MDSFKENSIETIVTCFHCGEFCGNRPVQFHEKNFCCQGCRTVYEILNKHDLDDYYRFEKTPGIKTQSVLQKFDYLVGQEIENLMLDYRSDKLAKVRFQLPAIHCSSCIWLLENLNRIDDGILNSEVDFPKRVVQIDFDPEKLNLKDIAILLTRLGYVPDINLKTKSGEKTRVSSNSVVLKLGIAGFCFGNVMLLSFPQYFGFEIEPAYSQYFTLISLLLSLPVILYAATGYFISAINGLRSGFFNIDVPISLGIVTLFLKSNYDFILFSQPGYFDSLCGLVFFLLIGKWIQQRTYRGLNFDRDFKSYLPLAVLKNDGVEKISFPVEKLETGDIITVRNQEIVPADCIVQSEKINVDYSFVTGESDLIEISQGQRIFGGAKILGHAANLEIEKKPSQSYLLSLWEKAKTYQEPSTQFLINRISRYFTLTVMSLATAGGLFWWAVDPSQSILVFTSVLIVACPCALALATPFTLGSAMISLAKKGFYLKNQSVIEQLWKTTHIVFDKTGTLTAPLGESLVKYHGDKLSKWDQDVIGKLTSTSMHPYSRIINDYLKNKNGDSLSLETIEEIPGTGIKSVVENKTIWLRKVPDGNSGNISYIINEKEIGVFSIQSNYRKGINNLTNDLKQNYSLSLLSGDSDSDEQILESMLPKIDTLKFRQTPEQKVSYIEDLQSNGAKVMMLGDGLNDASALSQSDIGIAVTDQTNMFNPACDIIMNGDSLDKLNQFLKLSLNIRVILIFAFTLSLLYNILGLGFAITGNLTPLVAAILMPLSSITVVLFSSFGVRLMARFQKL